MDRQKLIHAMLRMVRGRPLKAGELAAAIHWHGSKKEFAALLAEFTATGVFVKKPGGRYAPVSGEEAVTGILSLHSEGYGFVIPDGDSEDIYIPARFLRGIMDGDQVEARVVPTRGRGRREGRIVTLLERRHTSVIGRYEQGGDGGFVTTTERRVSHTIFIPSGQADKAQPGQVVVAEITNYPTATRGAVGRVVEVLGNEDDPEVEVTTIIRRFALPTDFSLQAKAEATRISPQVGEAERQGRVDLRELRTVTIDGETARDFDDAVSVRREAHDAIRLWVSIADVSHYVKPGSALDRDAYERGTSVYFPDRCIPMLPEELSNGICSLNPKVERLALTVEMLFNSSGAIQNAAFYPSVISSNARLTYTEVKKIIVDDDRGTCSLYPDMVADLSIMKDLALLLTARRRQRGSIDFDLPEPEVIIDITGKTEAIIRSERTLAHRLIEEFMLAANETVATYLESRSPSLYRVHEAPAAEKLIEFAKLVHHFGYTLRITDGTVASGELQHLLAAVAGKPEERLVNQVLLRSMKQARYTAENLGHFGLAAACYTHFTSPIRRYPDLVVHRLLKGVLSDKATPAARAQLERRLPDIADQSSRRERLAMEAEREIVTLKKVQFMADKVGEEYDAVITGVAAYGFFAEPLELFVEGLVHLSQLPFDTYRFLEKEHSLRGERTRAQFRLGDQVRVRVVSVSIERLRIDFTLVGAVAQTATTSGTATADKKAPATRNQDLHQRRKPKKGGRKPGGRGRHR